MECRTCLASGVRFFKLNVPMQALNDAQERKMTFLECLQFCTRLDNIEGFSNHICVECSRALEISFVFIKNAITANAILLQRANQNIQQDPTQTPITITKSDQLGAVKFRCKICQEKLDSKSALKNHVKLHMDVITYRCQLCDFDCKKRTHLSEHYNNEHNMEASSTQLKPLMQHFKTDNQDMDIEEFKQESTVENEEPRVKSRRLMRLEERKREEEEAQKLLQELEESLSQEKQIAKAATTVYDQEFQALDELSGTAIAMDQLATSIIPDDSSLSNEFVMMPDGSVQKVDGAGILIEYIDEEVVNIGAESVPFLDGNDLIVDNTVQIDASCNTEFAKLDFAGIIEEPVIENSGNVLVNTAQNNELPTTSTDTYNKQNYCKICSQVFGTRSELKTHMLSHSEIPHFFCDRCSFYTFFKNDLTQHYKSKHHVHPSSRQLRPKNKNDSSLGLPVYSCDLCFFETAIRLDLQHHYLGAHKVEANDIQLRPTVDNTDIAIKRNVVNKRNDFREASKISNSKNVVCKLCKKNFHTQREYREHLLWHKQEKKNEALRRLLETNAEDMQREFTAKVKENKVIDTQTQYETTTTTPTTTATMAVAQTTHSLLENNTNNASMHSMHIENNVILPMEAIPQVIGSEQTIAQDGQMDFDFNGDDIFDDFDNVNDNKDEHDDEIGNLVLTSEDELDDMIEENGGKSNAKTDDNPIIRNDHKDPRTATVSQQLSAYCVQCNKHFLSQYQFENHMFIHRGLAPYRCEMCTNLYSTKRALIKHYKFVHKRMPTRDMIQAKGDKAEVTQFDTALLDSDNAKEGIFMCAKCPFESIELLNLQLHLSNTHGITDQNFVLQKLQFECPRCIRSFETKMRLMRHLERNHCSELILEQKFKASNMNNTQPTLANAVNINNPTAIEEQHQHSLLLLKHKQHSLSYQQHQQLSSSTTAIGSTPRRDPPLLTEERPRITATNTAIYSLQQQQLSSVQAAASSTTTSTSTTTSSNIEQQQQPSQPQQHGEQQQQQSTHKLLEPHHIATKKEWQHQQEDFNNLKIVGEKYPIATIKYMLVNTSETQTSQINATSSYEEQSTLQDSFVCEICQNKYKSATLLKFHKKRHTERKYRCQFCPKSYITRTDLNTHTTLHTGNLRFKCEICDKKFGYSHHLKRHRETIHLRTRLVCTVADCGKVFSSKTQLNLHRREHNGTQPFKCPYCQKVFNRREYFRQHTLKSHNIRLSEAEIAEVYRSTTGYYNPHDLLVANEGKFVRRNDIEALTTIVDAVANIPTENDAINKDEFVIENAVDT